MAWVGGDSVGGDATQHEWDDGVATEVAWNAGGPAFAQISSFMDSPPGWGGKRSRRTAPSGATHSQMPLAPTLE